MSLRLYRSKPKPSSSLVHKLAVEALEARDVPAAFTAGNIVVLQADASANNTTVSIIELSPTTAGQTPTNTIPILGTGTDALRFSGSATSTGYLSRTNDGSLLTFNGANTTDMTTTGSSLNPRAVGTLNAGGNFAIATTYTGASGNQTRSSTSLNNSTYLIADQNGLYTNNSTSASPGGNFRPIQGFGGTVYVGQASGTATNIQVATVSAPSGGTITGLPGLTNNASLQDFYLIQSGDNGATYDVLYVVSATGNTAGSIAKYSLVDTNGNNTLGDSGDMWTLNGTPYATTFGGFGLAAADNGSGALLYVSTGLGALVGNSVLRLSDTAGYNAAITITTANNVTLYTAPAGKIVKGVAFAPAAGTPAVTNASTTVGTQTTSGLVITASTTAGEATNFYKITGITNGTLFQNNGTTVIANGDFITRAEGAAGLKFTPNSGTASGSFMAQASTTNADVGLGGTPVTATITVTAPVNQPPMIAGGPTASYNVAENTTAVTTVTATDDPAQTLTYSVSGGADAAKFTINSSTGVLSFITAPDFETPAAAGGGNVYNVTVQVTDSGTPAMSATQAITVTVTDVAAGTLSFSSATYSTAEGNSGTSTATITVNRSGGTDATSVNYATSDGTATAPSDYVAASGTLTFGIGVNSLTFDITVNGDTTAEPDETVNLTLSGAPAGTTIGTGTAVLTITNDDAAPNAPPVVTTSAGATTYGENANPLVIDPGIIVTDDGPNLTGATVQIAAAGYANGQDVLGFTNTTTIMGTFDAASGTLTLTGTDTVTNYQTALASVTYFNNSDDPSTATRTVTFVANDGTNLSTAKTKEITVIAVNDAPTLDAIGNVTVAEGAATQTVNLSGIGTGGEAGQTLTFTATSSNTGLIPNPTVTYTSPNVTGTLQFTPVANAFGTATITVTVMDNGGTASGGVDMFQRTFTITVTEVNDPPTAVDDTIADIAEDSGDYTIAATALTGNDTRGPANESGQTLTITAVSNPTGGTVSVVGGNVVFSPAANFNGVAGFDYTVTDDGTTDGNADPLTATAHVTFTVTPVNDEPTAGNDTVADIPEDSGAYTIAATALTGNDMTGPANESTQTLTITGVVVTTGRGTATVTGGNVVFTPDADFNGPVVLTYTVTDDGTTNGNSDPKTATATISFTVNSINDAPAGADETVTTNEDISYVFAAADFGFTDANDSPANALAAVRIATLPTAGTLTNNGTAVTAGQFVTAADLAAGRLRFTAAPDANGTGYASFTFQVQDDGGTDNGGQNLDPTPNTITVNVTAVNDAPTFTVGGNQTVAADAGAQTVADFASSFQPGPVTATDESGQTLVGYTVSLTNTTGNLAFSAAPAIDINGNLTYAAAAGASGTATLTVTAQDSGGGTDTSTPRTFTITVNAPPVTNPPGTTPPVSAAASAQYIAVGTDAGFPALVRVFDAATRNAVRDFTPFVGFSGGVRVALGDVDGDGRDDLIVATATGNAHVKVFDVLTGAELRSFIAFNGYFGGLTLAAADLNGDGRADIVVATATGNSHVKAFDGATGGLLRSFIAFPGFAGGVSVAAGDVTGDGRADIVVVAGPGGNGHVKAFDGNGGGLVASFIGYAGYNDVVNVAVGDVTGSGRGEIVTTALNPERGTHVKAFTTSGVAVKSFFAAVESAPAAIGVGARRDDQFPVAAGPAVPARVATADVTGDRVADYLLGSPPGAGTSRIVLVNGANGTTTDSQIALDPLFGFGVFVGVN